MKKWGILAAVIAAVGGVGYLGWDLTQRLDRAEGQVLELTADLTALEDDHESLEDDFEDLPITPDLTEDIASLSREIEQVDRRQLNDAIKIYEYLGALAGGGSGTASIEVSASDIDRPAFCLAGDPVYWGWNGGLDCRP